MYKLIVNLSILFILIQVFGCASKNKQDYIIGEWQLTEWYLEQRLDINGDGVKSTNLLEEINCPNKEVLIFEPHNVVSFNNTFNPIIRVFLTSKTPNTYNFKIECDDQGVISHATLYSLEGNQLKLGDKYVKLESNKISIIYKDKIKVYNEDYSKIIETKDIVVIYTKS